MGQFIIYGAGNRGKWCLDFLEWRNMGDKIFAFCDQNYAKIRRISDKEVLSYDEAKEKKLPFLVSNVDETVATEILDMLHKDGQIGYGFEEFHKAIGEEHAVFLREWCAYHHAKDNDQWFSDSETREEVDVFWNDDSLFNKFFGELDLHNVIELASGRGRHVPHYIDKAGTITLVDILEENMVICKERFKGANNIKYYKNNGYNLEKLSSDSYTALFTYDAMVHFEMMDVYEYLKDIYRVLVDGGKALFHHSNYTDDYKVDFAHGPHARCFMSKDIFAYLSHRAGFEVIEQKVIDWWGVKELDCITLLEKKCR
ncbi:MAG: class I SAM-dependent methyltransferase [Lachnospiraceae bacterium]|nr:class I SAM-dependent methyltransferase [Lachnospiraceae bacterium]